MNAPTRNNVAGDGSQLGYGALLGDKFFRLAEAPDRRIEVVTAPLEAPRVNTGSSPEDFTSEFGTRFSRSSFSGGEGRKYASRSQEPDEYFDSRNIEVDAEGSISLLNSMEELDSGDRLAYVDGTLYATSGTTLRATSDPGDPFPTFGNESPHAAEGATTVTDVVGIGSTVYASVADGIHRKTSGGAWAHWHGKAGVERLWTAKGRLFAAVGNTLVALDTGAVPSEVTVLTIAVDATFNDLTDGGSHILVTATDGYVYSLTDDGTDLALAGQTFLEGEVPYGIGESFGVVVLGTAQGTSGGGVVGRLYTAEVGPTLTNIQRRRVWESTGTLDRTPRFVVGFKDSLYTAVAETASETDLWRFDLPTGALHRSYIVDEASVVDAVGVGDRIWTSGGWRRSDLFPSDGGYLISPTADLFTSQSKAWAAVDVTFSELAGTGETVAVDTSTSLAALEDADDEDWMRASAYTTGERTATAQLSQAVSRYLAVKLTLTPSSDLAVSPRVDAFSVRAYPQSEELIVRFPILVSDQVERPGKARVSIRRRGLDLNDALAGLEGASTTLEMPLLDLSLRGIVESVERPYPSVTRRGYSGQWAWVRFRGSRLREAADTGGLVLMGTYSNGLGLMGTSPTMGATA